MQAWCAAVTVSLSGNIFASFPFPNISFPRMAAYPSMTSTVSELTIFDTEAGARCPSGIIAYSLVAFSLSEDSSDEFRKEPAAWLIPSEIVARSVSSLTGSKFISSSFLIDGVVVVVTKGFCCWRVCGSVF